MFILHGIYHFKPKVVAYRNDFCLLCAAPRRAYQIRSFDVFHLFYIPVLPLGFWRRWQCLTCKRDPHVHPHTRRSFKWAGVVVLAIFETAAWMPDAIDKDSATTVWIMRVGLPIAFIAALWWAIRSKPDINLKEKLKEILPAQDNFCPLCKGPFVVGSQWRCSNCGVERTALRT